jgi:hypothetical protein
LSHTNQHNFSHKQDSPSKAPPHYLHLTLSPQTCYTTPLTITHKYSRTNMSSIVNALSDLVKSLVELVWSFFTTAGALVQKTAQFALNFATEIIDLVVNFFRGLVDLAGGIVSFILGKLAKKPPTRVPA